MSEKINASEFVKRLKSHRSEQERIKLQRYFKTGKGEYAEGDKFIGIRMGTLFALAKEFIEMPSNELKKLLVAPIHEVRAGALSIMDKQARSKKTTPARRKELFDLYFKHHDYINNWDLVDLAAPHVVGGYLFDKPRDVLYKLARSKNMWKRRTAIVSTAYFIRQGDLDDAFKIAEILVNDEQDLIHKATGWMLRYAGDKDRKRLLAFLDKHAATMPRTLLRASIEKFDGKQREYYLGLKRRSAQ
jgi:3-methyladenine DNA glycosylase AlkD